MPPNCPSTYAHLGEIAHAGYRPSAIAISSTLSRCWTRRRPAGRWMSPRRDLSDVVRGFGVALCGTAAGIADAPTRRPRGDVLSTTAPAKACRGHRLVPREYEQIAFGEPDASDDELGQLSSANRPSMICTRRRAR